MPAGSTPMFQERGWLLRNPILWFIIPLLAVVLLVAGLGGAPWPVVALATALLLLLCGSHLTIRVDDAQLRLTYFPFWRRTISVKSLQATQVGPYRWGLYGGWGIRFGFDGSISYSVWEKECVRLTLSDHRPLNIGTRRPHELEQVLQRAMTRFNHDQPRTR